MYGITHGRLRTRGVTKKKRGKKNIKMSQNFGVYIERNLPTSRPFQILQLAVAIRIRTHSAHC